MGSSSQQTQQTQQSSTKPWDAATPTVNGIFDQLNPLIANSGINHTQTNALNTIEANAANGPNYAPQIQGLTSNLLGGGGATNQAGAVNQNYADYMKATQPLASNTNYNPYNTPGFSDAIRTMTGDITNNTNGQFAAAGRDFSGANSMALGRGIAAGVAPAIAGQYNTNVANQQNAANALYGAGNTTAGALTNMNQQGLVNAQGGATLAPTAFNASNAGANATLAAEALRTGIPGQNLGLLSQIGIPLAGLGSNSTGSGTSNTTATPSMLSQIQQGSNIAGSMFGNAGGAGSMAGLLSFLSDRRLKEDIARIGTLFDGTPVYRFRYVGQAGFQIGLMAQDVEKTTPEAVSETPEGWKAVNYQIATEKATRCLDWGC